MTKQTEAQTKQPVDPSELWWGPTFQGSQPNVPAIQEASPPRVEPWRWRYSPLVGIMYGPIPVGLIIAIPFVLSLLSP